MTLRSNKELPLNTLLNPFLILIKIFPEILRRHILNTLLDQLIDLWNRHLHKAFPLLVPALYGAKDSLDGIELGRVCREVSNGPVEFLQFLFDQN